MCGIFGVLPAHSIPSHKIRTLSRHSEQRGHDASGIVYHHKSEYSIHTSNRTFSKSGLISTYPPTSSCLFGHTRLVTNGNSDSQPLVSDGIIVLHNGIITNESTVWQSLNLEPRLQIDTEVLAALTNSFLSSTSKLFDLPDYILSHTKGAISCLIVIPHLGKLVAFTNTGSLYYGIDAFDNLFISSESYPLTKIKCTLLKQLSSEPLVLDIPQSRSIVKTQSVTPDYSFVSHLPSLNLQEKNLLLDLEHNLKRCSKCILPETMPFIEFNEHGVCNYCLNYRPVNTPKSGDDFIRLLEPYRRSSGPECIIPFSGGRDSCLGLHIMTQEVGMRAITYTYDWGMVTDLARRNISRMCSTLGVENIIISANIQRKRENIKKNLTAWLKRPNLGMLNILTAGDKHFFRHVNTVRRQTGVSLNVWSVNPLETTHFKTGFLGIPPNFAKKSVYTNGLVKQIRYQSKRFLAMKDSPGYFNSSLLDTLSGEFFRSFQHKSDYVHTFDYYQWDEQICNALLKHYDWEFAPDTSTSWRIGDGTAAFYNYVNFIMSGFTEHDTFRSNQIREGQLTREQALTLVNDENRPRFQNIKWYLDAVNLDYTTVISRVNESVAPFFGV